MSAITAFFAFFSFSWLSCRPAKNFGPFLAFTGVKVFISLSLNYIFKISSSSSSNTSSTFQLTFV